MKPRVARECECAHTARFTIRRQIISGLLANSLQTAELTPDLQWKDVGPAGTGSGEAKYINFLTFKDLEGSVREDVARIRCEPL